MSHPLLKHLEETTADRFLKNNYILPFVFFISCFHFPSKYTEETFSCLQIHFY